MNGHEVITSTALPTRGSVRVATAICRICFCAVPADQLETHEGWHAKQKKMRS